MAIDLVQLKEQMYDIYDKYTLQAEAAKKEGDDWGIVRAQSRFHSDLGSLTLPIFDACPDGMYSDDMPEYQVFIDFLIDVEVKGGLIGP